MPFLFLRQKKKTKALFHHVVFTFLIKFVQLNFWFVCSLTRWRHNIDSFCTLHVFAKIKFFDCLILFLIHCIILILILLTVKKEQNKLGLLILFRRNAAVLFYYYFFNVFIIKICRFLLVSNNSSFRYNTRS